MTPNEELIAVGRKLGVQSLLGQPHPVLQREAEAHAVYQARVQKQGHQGWEQRCLRLREQIQSEEFSEVANESWPNQRQEAAAKEMYRSWRLSHGHWVSVNGPCRYYGYAMVKGSNGIWYACGIFAK
jgi:hypothetical protein